jgi:hypothetical protein
MKKDPISSSKGQQRKIVGLSLPEEVATEFKMEAIRRDMTLRQLFLEMWTHYKKTST